ncbi:MAG: hypothetical protein U9R77_07445 [Pseudomonadota bacterium]|nr:hypothetical protein [Pseudomonadota bacterium]
MEEGQLTPSSGGGDAMFGIGCCLIIVAIIMLLIAFKMETSTTVDVPYAPGLLSGVTRSESIQNIGLLQRQMMTFQAGGFAFISGTICVCVALLMKNIRPPS